MLRSRLINVFVHNLWHTTIHRAGWGRPTTTSYIATISMTPAREEINKDQIPDFNSSNELLCFNLEELRFHQDPKLKKQGSMLHS